MVRGAGEIDTNTVANRVDASQSSTRRVLMFLATDGVLDRDRRRAAPDLWRPGEKSLENG